MKKLILSSIAAMLVAAIAGRVSAQSQGVAAKEKMKPFASWEGRWQGEGAMQMGPGEPHHSTVDERIESKLDGTLMLIEGVGKSVDAGTHKERISHHALGIVSFDASNGKYKFNTYLQDGRSTEAWLIVVADNRFQWGFETARGKTRYNITLDPVKKTWNERGEFSSDGNEWKQFFEMNLTKVEE
jgi:hypothetical protein